MSDLTEFHKQAATIALIKMLNGKNFSICDLNNIAKTIGREKYCAGRDYDALHSLHCINYADMGHELADQVREKTLEILGLPTESLNAIRKSPSEPDISMPQPAGRPAPRLKLAFWNRS